LFGIPVAVTAFLIYLPFYVGFDSQAGGVVPNFMFVTRGAHLWVMWGTLFVPLFAYLIYAWRSKAPVDWRAGLFTALGILIVLLLAMLVISLFALKFKPDLVNLILQSQTRGINAFITDSLARRLKYIGSLITLLALLIPAFAFLFGAVRSSRKDEMDEPVTSYSQPSIFVFLLLSMGTLLIMGPDFLYLRDNFGYRINTVFKFYYEAWILLSLVAAF